MSRELVVSCWPFLAAIVVSVGAVGVLLKVAGARLRLTHLKRLHRDEIGGVQSLSFVATLPLFIMILMFIVQLSQITIAKVVVEHAAFAAARSAIVWIPANLGNDAAPAEQENRIGLFLQYVETLPDGARGTYDVFEVQPGGRKLQRIHFAAALACLSICPSRDVGAEKDAPVLAAANALQKAYVAMAPSSASNTRIPDRLKNKIAYSIENTHVRIRIHHKSDEPPLRVAHDVPPYLDEFAPNEIGWQDRVEVKVEHDFALLPGPARILARLADARPGTSPEESYSNSSAGKDAVARRIRRDGRVFVYRLNATARLTNEGEKSVLSYVQRWRGSAGYNPNPYWGQSDESTDDLSGDDGMDAGEDGDWGATASGDTE